jgi:rubrerythrin
MTRTDVVDALHHARAEEKAQALFYRALASLAEDVEDEELAERLNGLHADEQHHLSRLSARLVELGQPLEDLSRMAAPAADLHSWETVARRRELVEIERYLALESLALDDRTAAMIREFLDAERRHEAELGGKWMRA